MHRGTARQARGARPESRSTHIGSEKHLDEASHTRHARQGARQWRGGARLLPSRGSPLPLRGSPATRQKSGTSARRTELALGGRSQPAPEESGEPGRAPRVRPSVHSTTHPDRHSSPPASPPPAAPPRRRRLGPPWPAARGPASSAAGPAPRHPAEADRARVAGARCAAWGRYSFRCGCCC